ncbi:hypothetical protein ILYODFUR_034593 [Ilyodon furcidens]|uniref:Uncharacterized protein n=1 Tax=Ilyodon furcidens TaxID=33524 RepID=A0ABV0VK61_9TELE
MCDLLKHFSKVHAPLALPVLHRVIHHKRKNHFYVAENCKRKNDEINKAPLKKKVIIHRRLAPWFNSELGTLKHNVRRLERKWRSTHLEDSYLAYCYIKRHFAKPEQLIPHH